ncbi:unnamed protein product [Paramecium sonneborni]|uniref:Uncharacterized protein n=1 Tax=Paramecium sonneborni TaxID=65129 RepID=A0A8S1N7V2_9CILI|nr:unnamed protein product [Paramecium sonneborni]
MKINDFYQYSILVFQYEQKFTLLYLNYRFLQELFNQMRVSKIDNDSFNLKYYGISYF